MKSIFIAFTLKNSSVAEFFIELANQLSINNKVVIITHSVEPNTLKINKSIEILRWPGKRPTGFKDFIFLSKLVRKYKPEIMISNFAAVNIFLTVGYFFRVKRRIAWYRTLTTQLEDRKFLKFRKRIIYRFATQIFANSIATKNDLIKSFNVNKNKIKVIVNAAKDPHLGGIDINDNKIVYVGRMDVIKGVLTLLQAMPEVIRFFPNIHLHIIGGNLNGDRIDDYKSIAKKIGIENNVIFKGNKGKSEVLKEFSDAFVTIVPSLVEAFGFVIIESFSVKTPVIGSNTTGISEIVRDGIDGYLFEPGNSEELASRIIYLYTNRHLRKTFSNNCYSRFKTNYELKTQIELLCSDLSNASMNGPT